MELTFTNTTGKLTLKTEAPTPIAAFETIAMFGDVFDETKCGVCGSEHIRFDVRRPKTFVYYNLVCRDCGCRLDVSQHRDKVNLYIDRKDANDQPKHNAGWYKYTPDWETGDRGPGTGKTPAPVPTQAPPQRDTELALIATAKHKGTLREIGERIRAEVAAGRIDAARAANLRQAYEKRERELSRGGKVT